MKRRDFIAASASALAAPALCITAAQTQQAAMPVIGFLGPESPDLWADSVRSFRVGLAEIGFVEGRNVAIEFRWAQGRYEPLPALAADLVNRSPAVIAVGGTPATLAAKAATTIIPIVFAVASDPVELGLVASLNKPGGNLTGTSGLGGGLGPK